MNEEMNVGAMLAEQLQRLLEQQIDRDALIAAEERGLTHELWRAVDDMGIALALLPETAGGAGLGWRDIEPALRIAGMHAAPLPLGETLLANWALALAGIEVPAGPLAVIGGVLTLGDGGGLSGGDDVPWAQHCPQLVAAARRGDERFLCLIDTAACAPVPLETIGRIPTAAVTLRAVQPAHIAPLPTSIGADDLLPHIATLRAVQIAGALARVLALCIDYGNTRVQFGRPIGKFQAIQHQLAELAEQAAAAQVAGLLACRRIDAGDAAYGAAIAKSYAGRAATRGAAIAHQVFGAIGVTDEHLLHYFSRRLWQWRSEGGSEHEWSERLGRRVLAQPGAALWPSIADSGELHA